MAGPGSGADRLTTAPVALRPDCTSCCGLCCVAPAFDADQGFGYDKPAYTPCRHLQPDCQCAIHSQLAAIGFPGCAQFDCHGAGQRVTQQVFGGRSWQESPELAQRMFGTYSRLLPLHELMSFVDWALPRVATDADRERLREQLQAIDALGDRIAAAGDAAAVRAIRAETLALLRERLPPPFAPRPAP